MPLYLCPADIENAQGSQAGTNNGDMIPPTWVGSGFITHQMNDQLNHWYWQLSLHLACQPTTKTLSKAVILVTKAKLK
jgi:hypothetical protein